jgi:hypothetical protein
MRKDELVKLDLLSEIVLLSSGVALLVTFGMALAAALATVAFR